MLKNFPIFKVYIIHRLQNELAIDC